MEAVYVDHMGDDLRVVNAARVSFAKESEYVKPFDDLVKLPDSYKGWDDPKLIEYMEYILGHKPIYSEEIILRDKNKINDKDYKLINYLAKHGHWTPFAHPQITIREKVPIFVARQRFKHMVGFVYNEVSRRYVDDEPEFFWPTFRWLPEGSIKQGSGDDIARDHPFFGRIEDTYSAVIHDCRKAYNTLLDLGVAPEQARMVLPQSMYTEYYVTGSLAAWARAYKQRIDSHAQKEIQELAVEWNKIIEPLFPVSWKALTQNVKSET